MKRIWVLFSITVGLCASGGALLAEEGSTAAAIANRQEAEERYQRLNSAVEDWSAALAAVQKRVESLNAEVQRLRTEVNRLSTSPTGYATVEDVKRLAEKVQELDRKREADKNLILEEIQKLARASVPVRETPRSSAPPPPSARSESPPAESGYEYVIKGGDSYSKIAEECTRQGLKVTAEQLMKANPKTKPDRLIPGRKIFIPGSAPRGQ